MEVLWCQTFLMAFNAQFYCYLDASGLEEGGCFNRGELCPASVSRIQKSSWVAWMDAPKLYSCSCSRVWEPALTQRHFWSSDFRCTPIEFEEVVEKAAKSIQTSDLSDKTSRWWFQIFVYVHPYLGKMNPF